MGCEATPTPVVAPQPGLRPHGNYPLEWLRVVPWQMSSDSQNNGNSWPKLDPASTLWARPAPTMRAFAAFSSARTVRTVLRRDTLHGTSFFAASEWGFARHRRGGAPFAFPGAAVLMRPRRAVNRPPGAPVGRARVRPL